MGKNKTFLLFIVSSVVFTGFMLFIQDDFSSRFKKGLKIKANDEEIFIEQGSLAPFVADWNNDGKKDLIVGQFKDAKIRLYLNYGTDAAPVFKQYSYLKAGDKEICLTYGWCLGAYPQVVDWNNDGKNDLLVGDMIGNVWIYFNIGTKENPVLAKGEKVKVDGMEIGSGIEFKDGSMIISGNNFGDPKQLYGNIHFTDWDNDALKDLLIGHINQVYVYKNIGTIDAPLFAKPIALKIGLNGYPTKSSPCLFDWDNDGRKDLFLGDGKLNLYRNTGTKEKPEYAEKEVIKIDETEFNKHFDKRMQIIDWNNDGKDDLIVGTTSMITINRTGNIWLFLGK